MKKTFGLIALSFLSSFVLIVILSSTSVEAQDRFLYVGTMTSPAKTIRINLTDFSRVDTITFASGENNAHVITIWKDYIYAGLGMSPTKIIKIRRSDFTIVDRLQMTEGWAARIFAHDDYLYVSHAQTGPVITKIDLNTFTKVGSLTLQARLNAAENGFLYATDPGESASVPHYLYKINESTFQ